MEHTSEQVPGRDRPVHIHHIELAKVGFGLSGGEKCLIELCKYLADRYTNSMYTPAHGRDVYLCNGIPERLVSYVTIGNHETERRFGVLFSYVLRTLQSVLRAPVLDERESHVVVSHSPYWPNWLFGAFLKWRYPDITWIVIVHMLSPRLFYGYQGEYTNRRKWPSLKFLHNWLNDMVFLKVAAPHANCLVVTNPMYLYNRRLNQTGVPVVAIQYGSDSLALRQSLTPSVISDKIYDCVFVGRFHPQKGLGELAIVWDIVQTLRPDTTLAIVGGEDTHELAKPLKQLQMMHPGTVDSIHWLGYREGLDKLKVQLQSRVFVFPSLYESYGIVAVEAMSCGLPVVAFNLPPFDAFGDNMIKVPIGDHKQFALAIVRLLDDLEWYSHQAAKAESHGAKYTWQRTGEQFDKVMQSIIRDKSRGSGDGISASNCPSPDS